MRKANTKLGRLECDSTPRLANQGLVTTVPSVSARDQAMSSSNLSDLGGQLRD